MLGRTILEAINVLFEKTAISFNDRIYGQICKRFKEIVEITPIGFKRVLGFLQTRLRDEKISGESVCGDTRTPLPIDLMHDLCPLLDYLRVTLLYYVAEVQPF
jgi:hypothetical protein